MRFVLSALMRLASASFGGGRRRRVSLVLVLAAILLGGAGWLLFGGGRVDPDNGKKIANQTTFSSHDGSYKVTVITYADGTRREIRSDKRE